MLNLALYHVLWKSLLILAVSWKKDLKPDAYSIQYSAPDKKG